MSYRVRHRASALTQHCWAVDPDDDQPTRIGRTRRRSIESKLAYLL